MLSFLSTLWSSLLGFIGALLPDSPFRNLALPAGSLATGLGWLNWFVPFESMIALFGFWLAGLIAYGVFRFVTKKSFGLVDDAVRGGGK